MSDGEVVRIVLPMPPRVLSPNGQHGHWTRRAAALKKCRKLARRAIEDEAVDSAPWDTVEVKATFYHTQKRRRDGANYNAMLKGYIDGVVDADLIPDDDSEHLTLLPPDFRTENGLTRVEMVISRTK